MAKSANQKIKTLYVMKMLLENTDEDHGMSLEDITAKLASMNISAERKTLYDDIEVLRTFGIDIEMRRSKTTTYHVVSREFEMPELKLLVDAVQSSKFITHKKSNELIRKIEGFASRHEAQKLQRQVFVAGRIKTMNESIYYSVDDIYEAIIKNVKISFKYFEWNERKEKVLRKNGQRYVVSPWALTWDDENYYLIAYDSIGGGIRHYRVDKMSSLQLTDERRDGAETFERFDIAQYSKRTFGMFGGDEHSVTIRCKNSLAGVIIDRFGSDVSFIKDGEDHFKFTTKVQVSPMFLSWIINFGKDVKILSPQVVIDRLKELAYEAAGQYE